MNVPAVYIYIFDPVRLAQNVCYQSSNDWFSSILIPHFSAFMAAARHNPIMSWKNENEMKKE
jgi:hypothetical protein